MYLPRQSVVWGIDTKVLGDKTKYRYSSILLTHILNGVFATTSLLRDLFMIAYHLTV